jgi:hypothetical protein
VENVNCPKCGQKGAEEANCPNCGYAASNGAGPMTPVRREKPVPPPEVANWVIEPIPPELIEEFRRTFNEEEVLAALREYEETGGYQLEDFIGEIEEIVKRRD